MPMKNHFALSRQTQILTLLVGVSMAALPATADIFDNFNVGTTPNPAWDFLDLAGNGAATQGSGTYNIGGSGTATTRTDGLFADGVFRVDLMSWTTGVPGTPPGAAQGLLFRYSPVNGTSYGLIVDEDGTPTLSFIRLNNFQLVDQQSETGILALNAAGTGYTLEAIAVGNTFTGNLYNKSDNSLIVSITWSDSTLSSAGRAGLLIANDGTPTGAPFPAASFDNFSAVVPVPEPGTLALFALGAVVTGIGLRKRR